MADCNDPKFILSDACISLTESLLKYRASVTTVDDANQIGRDLFDWFVAQGAATDANAPYASRSIGLGIVTLEKNSVETIEDAVSLIQETYQHYTQGA